MTQHNETIIPSSEAAIRTDEALRRRGDDRIAFLKGFLREPKGVGSIIPSSRQMERRLARVARLAAATSVVELGPGTGGTTRSFLRAMPHGASLMAIELDALFADHVRRSVHDSRLIVHQGSAEAIGEALASYRMPAPQAVISGIPFSTMPAEIGRRIIEAVRDVLAPGGCFVAYQFRDAVARLANPILGEPDCDELELVNIPPMHVYRWLKPAN